VDILLGKRLEKGDTIGIVAPASIETEENIEIGIGRLNSFGFKVKKGKHIYDKWGYFAGEDKDRACDIMDMFKDKEVKMVLCIRGGYGAMRLLPYLDFNKIRRNPKIFMGYSDITLLLNSLYEKEGLITFHGPMLNSKLFINETKECFLSTVIEGYKGYCIKNPEDLPMNSNMDKSVEGRIVGGNLSLVCSSLGTAYEINTKNKILFLEDIDEEPYKIDRMLTQLILSRKLQQCKGFILGQFTNCEEQHKDNRFSLNEVIADRILKLNKPTLMNLMCGHNDPKLILPIGAKAKLNCKSYCIDIIEPVCK
jgi:muramoyltetrapeptide carboxypeptidase